MEKLFLDTNIFIDIVENRDPNLKVKLLEKRIPLCISIVTPLVTCYLGKYEMPHQKLRDVLDEFVIVFANGEIIAKSLEGPTPDFEDNLQLHSAVEAGCNTFITKDKEILNLGYFGKMKLIESLD